MKKILMLSAATILLTATAPAFANEQCTSADKAAQMTDQAETAAKTDSAGKSDETTGSASNMNASADESSGAQATNEANSEPAEKVVDEIVKEGETAEDGTKVASTGPAEPKENWFGCPPEGTAPTG